MPKRRRGFTFLHRAAPGGRVERLEVFFDLIFVFAFFNITRAVSEHLTPGGLLRGLLVLALLWWAWSNHIIVANRIRISEGIAPLAIFAIMAATFTIALIIPRAFSDETDRGDGPFLFAGGYFVIRTLHQLLQWSAARGDSAQRRQIIRLAPPMLVATGLLIAAGFIPRHIYGLDQATARTVLWTLAVAVEYGAGILLGVWGWTVAAAGHWVERFELIIIIALGETIVSVGIGSDLTGRAITWPAFLGAMLSVSLTATLWWAYFDIGALAAQRTLYTTHGTPRVALARDAYIYLHVPMIAALILLALGGEELLHHLGQPDVDLNEPQPGSGVVLIYGGVILFLLGHVAFQRRILHTIAWTRLVCVAVLAALIPAAVHIPALAALTMLATICVLLIAAEAVLFAGARRAIRGVSLLETAEHEERETAWRRGQR